MHLVPESISGVDPFSRSLRVLHVLQPTEAGVWRYVNDMAAFQSSHGWQVHVASPARPAGELAWHEWRAQRNPAAGVREEIGALEEILHWVRPDVVVAHSSKAGLIVRLTLRGRLPTVFLPHAWSFSALSGPMAGAALAWERYACRFTNAIVGVGAAEISRGWRSGIAGPYFLVPNPVPATWQNMPVKDTIELGLAGRPAAVCVGRLTRQKGVDVLLDAWALVRARMPEAELVIVGDGPDRDELTRSAGQGVTFVGHSDNPKSYVQAAPVVVIPSRWEGLSLSMLEAMDSGRSIVATAVDGSEVVQQARSGAVVPVEDPAALAEEILLRVADPELAAAEGDRAHTYVRLHHDFDTSARRLAAVISRAYAFGCAPRARRRPVGV